VQFKPSKKSGRKQVEKEFCLAYSSTLKMEASCSSDTSVDFQRTTRRYITEDGAFHSRLVLGRCSIRSLAGIQNVDTTIILSIEISGACVKQYYGAVCSSSVSHVNGSYATCKFSRLVDRKRWANSMGPHEVLIKHRSNISYGVM
jgi:hypothetical protein